MGCRTGAPGTKLQKYEKDTWPHFSKLAQKLPEAGIHFQSKWLGWLVVKQKHHYINPSHVMLYIQDNSKQQQ